MMQHVHSKSRRKSAAWSATVLFAAAAGVSAQACGSDAGVVGGRCADGFTACGPTCVDTATDESNCGACGQACSNGVACGGGVCGGGMDATVDGSQDGSGDGSGGDGSGGDGSGGDGSGGDGSGGDGSGGDGSGGDGGGGDGSVCNPPYNTPAHCGNCKTQCVDPNGKCALKDGVYQCRPTCDPPYTDCSGVCVDITRDPNNCGKCGNVCPTPFCYQSSCVPSPGNEIVIGHDFQATTSGDVQSKLLTTSVFYNSGAIEVVSYERYSDPATVANGKSLLSNFASANGLILVVDPTQDDAFITQGVSIANVGVVLIWDQLNAPKGALGALGTQWATSLQNFTKQGGIVIALDSALGTGEMPALITNAGLLTVTGHTTLAAGSTIDVPASGNSIARTMPPSYGATDHSAWFTTSDPAVTNQLIYVANVKKQTAELLAVHKIVK